MGRTFIEDKVVEWKSGDAIYVPVWAWHYHENQSDTLCRYVACENAPLLQNLGGIALREEA
jgi:gentisate 1,2-dioxygenase